MVKNVTKSVVVPTMQLVILLMARVNVKKDIKENDVKTLAIQDFTVRIVLKNADVKMKENVIISVENVFVQTDGLALCKN
jgi:hypothetical protein